MQEQWYQSNRSNEALIKKQVRDQKQGYKASGKKQKDQFGKSWEL